MLLAGSCDLRNDSTTRLRFGKDAYSFAMPTLVEGAVCKQPPLSVFFGEAFEVEVVVGTGEQQQQDSATTAAASSKNFFEIDATLAEDDRFCHLVLLQVLPNKLQAGVTGVLHCSIRERNESITKTTSPFYEGPLLISARNDTMQTTFRTASVTCARYKIVVTPSSDWTTVWYKDEGGRDKCVTVMAEIYDHLQNLVRQKSVPLQLTLCYAAPKQPIAVNNQEIMRIIGNGSSNNAVEIDKVTGQAKIRFRVEDVSKNHQGQDFCVKISANKVAPGVTPPITIRSKRNKRNRLASSTTPSSSSSSKHQRLSSSSRNILSMNATASGTSNSYMSGIGSGPIASNNLARVQEALRGVEQWTESVVTGLYPLQWQVVGYAQDASGNPDYSRPYHPNALISRVLATYNESTRGQLQLLRRTFLGNELPARYPRVYTSGVNHDNMQAMPTPAMMPSHAPPPPGNAFSTMMRNRGQVVPLHSPSQRQLPFHMPSSSQGIRNVTSKQQMGSSLALSETITLNQPEEPSSPSDDLQQQHDDPIETKVEYLLAKQFKSLKTNERLGFPVYSADKDLLGFYQEFGKFVPIPSDFGPAEKLQAVRILETAPEQSVHAKQGRSISTLLNHALVYEWSQGLSEGNTKESTDGTIS